MKIKPYRLGALGIVFDDDNNILIVQLLEYSENEWVFPGGGRKDKDETPRENILRELTEELGLNESCFKIIGQSQKQIIYDFPLSMLKTGNKIAFQYRGQKKDQFFIRFLGNKADIRLFTEELSQHLWVPASELRKYLLFPGQLHAAVDAIKEYQTHYFSQA